MSNIQRLKKFNHESFNDIYAQLELDDSLASKTKDIKLEMPLLNTLIDEKAYAQAIQFLAFGLPIREAIWWGYVCIEPSLKASSLATTQSILRLVYQWVHEPTDTLRISSKKLADALELSTPDSWLAMSLYWSGGSIAPKGQYPVEPEPFMAGHAVSNALMMKATSEEVPETHYKLFLKKGLHIAMGGNGKI